MHHSHLIYLCFLPGIDVGYPRPSPASSLAVPPVLLGRWVAAPLNSQGDVFLPKKAYILAVMAYLPVMGGLEVE